MRDPLPEPDRDEEQDEPQGRLRPTPPSVLAGCFLAALVLGRAVRPFVLWSGGTPPAVGWRPVLALVCLVVVLLIVVVSTHRTVQVHGGRLPPHQAVNRLVLAKACAVAGALVAGGYAGYAISWVGVDSDLARLRLLQSVVSALLGAAVAAASLTLERACRVRKPDDRDLT